MKNYLVTYTNDEGRTFQTMTVCALDYTKAYLTVAYMHGMVIEVIEQ